VRAEVPAVTTLTGLGSREYMAEGKEVKPRGEAMSNRSGLFLKRFLLLFWTTWLAVVFASNVLDGCKALGVLDVTWPFASGNYLFLTEVTGRYGTPAWLNELLFLGVIIWEGVAALLFGLAWLRYRGSDASRGLVHAAFTVSLGLWAAFAVADELFIAYAVEATHLRLFTAQLATLLAIELLPEETLSHGLHGRTDS
jgi:hypothetical protein